MKSNEANSFADLKAIEFINALSHPETIQPQEGKDGDPQISALSQHLISIGTSLNKKILCDFGSGNGIVAGLLAKMPQPLLEQIEYWAIDLPEIVDKLFLPSSIHNISKKYSVDDFYNGILPRRGKDISNIIIRNVIHELDIVNTSKLFHAIKDNISLETEIYIQDMQKLPDAERENVGWEKSILKECLDSIGFRVVDFDLMSHGGTPWFAFLCKLKPDSLDLDFESIQNIIATHREKQFNNIEKQVHNLTKHWEKTTELLKLQNEYTSLSIQLRSVGRLSSSPTLEPSLQKLKIPVKQPRTSGFEYACATSQSVASISGLIAMISSKRLLDFPTLIASAEKNISFGGYSNRSLFRKDENVNALKKAILSGVVLQVLVVNPSSQAAYLRSMEPLYESPDYFISTINDIIGHGLDFYKQIEQELGESRAKERFQFKQSSRSPRWSYFIVDDTCYISFYSIKTSGSAAPCFVFRGLPNVMNNYFHVIRQEFLDLFSEAEILIK